MSRNRISVGGLFSPLRENESLDRSLLDCDLSSNKTDEYINRKKQSRRKSSEKNSSANTSKSDKISLQCKKSNTVSKSQDGFGNYGDDLLTPSCSRKIAKENCLQSEIKKKSSSNQKSNSSDKNTEKILPVSNTVPSNSQTIQMGQKAYAKALIKQRKEKALEKVQQMKNRCVSDYSENLQNTKPKKVHHKSDNTLMNQNITVREVVNNKVQKTIPDIKIQNHLGEVTEEMPVLNVAEPAKVSTNIIEKLISDAVSFEFDAVRQQLYHQQFNQSILINTRFNEIEEKNAERCEKLFEITQELMEENRALRNMLDRFIS